jgi:hypothetical protein
MTMQTHNVVVKMKDVFTGEPVERTIDKTNAMNMKMDGFFMGTKEEQAANLNDWILERANEQHETFLDLVSWEFV